MRVLGSNQENFVFETGGGCQHPPDPGSGSAAPVTSPNFCGGAFLVRERGACPHRGVAASEQGRAGHTGRLGEGTGKAGRGGDLPIYKPPI